MQLKLHRTSLVKNRCLEFTSQRPTGRCIATFCRLIQASTQADEQWSRAQDGASLGRRLLHSCGPSEVLLSGSDLWKRRNVCSSDSSHQIVLVYADVRSRTPHDAMSASSACKAPWPRERHRQQTETARIAESCDPVHLDSLSLAGSEVNLF